MKDISKIEAGKDYRFKVFDEEVTVLAKDEKSWTITIDTSAGIIDCFPTDIEELH